MKMRPSALSMRLVLDQTHPMTECDTELQRAQIHEEPWRWNAIFWRNRDSLDRSDDATFRRDLGGLDSS